MPPSPRSGWVKTNEAYAPALRVWLAELPCPVCKGPKLNPDEEHAFHILAWDAHGVAVPDCSCLDANGKPTGLALPWASTECPQCLGHGWLNADSISIPDAYRNEHPEWFLGCWNCKGFSRDQRGSGRVPKADLGLEEVVVRFEIELHPPGGLTEWVAILPTGEQGEADTPLLAALRAVAAQAGMRC